MLLVSAFGNFPVAFLIHFIVCFITLSYSVQPSLHLQQADRLPAFASELVPWTSEAIQIFLSTIPARCNVERRQQ